MHRTILSGAFLRRICPSGRIIIAAALLTAAVLSPAPASAQAKTIPVLTQALGDLEGKEVVMVTVEYAPGHASAPHRHKAHTFVYVLEGALMMGVKGGQPVRVEAGQTFYESPADVHTVARNASSTAPARFLVFFVRDQGASTMHPAEEPG